MLTRFSVKNFRGFKDEIVWDLSKHEAYDFNESAIHSGVISNGIIYGPNGSGKSNFTMALMDIASNLVVSQRTGFPNYVCLYAPKEPVTFSYNFVFGSDEVEYRYSKDSDAALISEYFLVNGKEIFHQNSDGARISGYDIQDRALDDFRNKNNNVSIINYLFNVYPLQADDPIIRLKNFVERMLWFNNSENRMKWGQTKDYSPEEAIINSNRVGEFSEFLKKVSDQDFDLAPLKDLSGDVGGINPLIWKVDGQALPFGAVCSTGTKALEALFSWIMDFEKFSFIVIDEFDAFYHFELAYNVCKYLFGHSENCQIFLTTHNTYLMTNDLLRPDCNFLLDRNVIKPLSDCTKKELSFASNIERMYRANSFRI